MTFDCICKRFGNNVVFDNFYCSFADGRVNCILAPSGSGKTTLLNIASGILKPDSGTVYGIPERIAYVFQDDLLIPEKTALQNLEFALGKALKGSGGGKQERAATRERINGLLAASGLSGIGGLYPRELSGGMRQRISLIRALAYPADFLLMDEPFKSLDEISKKKMILMFEEYLNSGKKTVLLVTHDEREAVDLGDIIYRFSDKPMKLIDKTSGKGRR